MKSEKYGLLTSPFGLKSEKILREDNFFAFEVLLLKIGFSMNQENLNEIF